MATPQSSPSRTPRKGKEVEPWVASLEKAKAVRHAALGHLNSRPQTTGVFDWTGTGIQGKLKQRVATTEGLVRALLGRIERTENLREEVMQRQLQLDRDFVQLQPPLEVVRRRLTLRAQRDAMECSDQDSFQLALEAELSSLTEGCQEIRAHVSTGQQVLQAMEAAKTALVEDLQFKRYALRLERSALRFDPFHGTDRIYLLPRIPAGGATRKAEVAPENGSDQMETAVAATVELLKRTRGLEEQAWQFCVSCDEMLPRVRSRVEKASQASTISMRQSIADALQAKSFLEKELAQSRKAIVQTEQSIKSMEQEIEHHITSMAQWEKSPDVPIEQFDQRLPPAVRESMRQSAVARTEEQMKGFKQSVGQLHLSRDEMLIVLQELRQAYAELATSLAAKTQTWSLNTACSKIALSSLQDAANSSSSSSSVQMTASTPRRSGHKLSGETLEMLRSRIKAAAYTGQNGVELDIVFGRLDKDGSGTLDFDALRAAVRRTWRLPVEVFSDKDAAAFFSLLDPNLTGSVLIKDLVAFACSSEPVAGSSPSLGEASTCLGSSVMASSSSAHSGAPAKGRRRLKKPSAAAVEALRLRLRAASYAGHLGREPHALFSRYDKDGCGKLQDEQIRQAFRRSLRIPPALVSDDDIAALCGLLDPDNQGAISITALVDFMAGDRTETQLASSRTYRALSGGASQFSE